MQETRQQNRKFKASLVNFTRSFLKVTGKKRAGNSSVVECWISMCKTLCSIHNIVKTKQNKTRPHLKLSHSVSNHSCAAKIGY